MLPLIQKMGDAADRELRKRALVCAMLSYVLFLVIVVLSFSPAKKTVAISVGVHGVPSAVRWTGSVRGRRNGATLKKRGQRGKKEQAACARRSIKKIAGRTIFAKKDVLKNRRKRTLNSKTKNRHKKGVKNTKKSKKIDRKATDIKPKIFDTLPEEKSAKKQPEKVAEPEIVTPKESEKQVEKELVAPVIPEKGPEKDPVLSEPVQAQMPEPVAEQMLEIGVGSQEIPSDQVDSEGEISRDEYALMTAVGRTWRPPRGLKAGLSARLVVSVAADGSVEHVDIVTSSQVPAYDMAARGSLYRAEYPPVFWGKNIAVVFGQGEKE